MKKIRINFPEKNETGVTTVRAGIPPIGNIIWTSDNVSPAQYWGGIWERFAEGKVVVGVNESDSDFAAPSSALKEDGTYGYTDKSGGSKDAIVVNHRHREMWAGKDGGKWYTYHMWYGDGTSWGYNTNRVSSNSPSNGCGADGLYTANEGSSGTNANLQPYIAAYCYRRIG